MARPVKWSRDAHLIRDRAAHSRTETWSRQDIEHLFGIGRASAQAVMKAIGEIQPVGGAHFIERTSLLAFLDAVIAAPSIEEGLRARLLEADPAPRPKPLRIALPGDLHSAMLPDLPSNITVEAGRIEIQAPTAEAMLESLMALAMVMQNDLDRVRAVLEPPVSAETVDDELRSFVRRLRRS